MKQHRVPHDTPIKLKDFDPDSTGDFGTKKEDKEKADQLQKACLDRLMDLQEMLYASQSRALLVVLQAKDTGGKDSTIRHVFSGVNPQGFRISSFKKPTPLELSHHFLWRIQQKVPPKGFIGIFNRSHYEDILVPRVSGQLSKKDLKRRYLEINEFERMLVEDGTAIVKFFLYISKEEQKERLEARLKNPTKHWKFNLEDLESRRQWEDYQEAYEGILSNTSTPTAPWYIVPANRKWYRNLVVAQTVVEELEAMKLHYPPPPAGVNFDKIRIP